MKIAIVTPPFLGHVLPTISVGRELLQKGYDVYWLSMLEHMKDLLPEGGRFIHLKSWEKESFPSLNYGMESLYSLYKKILVPLNRDLFHELAPVFTGNKFDLIITDQQAFAGSVIAFQYKIPYVTSVTAPAAIEGSPFFPEIIRFESEEIMNFQRSLNVNIDKTLVCSSPLTLIYSTKEFLQNCDFAEEYHFIGPSLSNRIEYNIDLSAIDHMRSTNPKVLVTLGSILKGDEYFMNSIIKAFENENISVVLVSDPGFRDKWPSNFLVYPYIPQLEVLEKVDAVVCHAGYNTVCEALSFGLPLITIPMVNDQSYVATKVTNSGAGIRLKIKRLKSDHLKEAIKELLNNPKYKLAAINIKRSFEEAGGSVKAAELIDRFIIHNNNQ